LKTVGERGKEAGEFAAKLKDEFAKYMDEAEKIGKDGIAKGEKKPKDITKKVYPGEKHTKKEVIEILVK